MTRERADEEARPPAEPLEGEHVALEQESAPEPAYADATEAGDEEGGAQADAAQSEVEEARAQARAYLDDLQRLKAEFENYRKRMAREQTAVFERASSSLIERLLPVLDNFELALLAADRTKDYEAMVRGVEMVYGELLELLHKEGLARVESLGKPFDPERHEAVMQTDGEGDELYVVDEMRPGYTIGGRVVRPAMVKVSRR